MVLTPKDGNKNHCGSGLVQYGFVTIKYGFGEAKQNKVFDALFSVFNLVYQVESYIKFTSKI